MTKSQPDRSPILDPAGIAAFVDAYVERHMAAAHAPGLVVAVVHDGEVILSRGYGFADLQTQRSMTAQTPVRAGSVSKAATSAAVLELAARGAIALDAPVSRYLPGLLPPQDGHGSGATVAQMLTLQGGYPDVVVGTHAPTEAQWQPLPGYLAAHLPARVHPPRRVPSYNSWEHALLGQAMAEVLGQPFPAVMEELLFRPLGMAHTTFAQPLPAPIAAALAAGYAYQGNGIYEEVPLDFVNLTPGIGMVTTGDDMARFMLALLEGGRVGGEQALARSTVAGMLTRQQTLHPRLRSRTYGLSELTLEGRAVLYHDGNGIGHGNRLILAPEHRLGIFLSVNHRPLGPSARSTPGYNFMKELGTRLLVEYLPPAPRDVEALPPLPDAAARAPRYTGHYRLAGTPQEDFFKLGALLDNVDVRAGGDGTVTIGSGRYVEVEPLLFQHQAHPSTFVRFVEDDPGEIAWLSFGGTGSYARARAHETPRFQLGLVALMVVGFLAFAAVTPFTGYTQWPIWLLSLLALAFLAGVALMMLRADLILFFKTIPPLVKLLFLIPWLVGLLALSYPLALAALWRSAPPDGVWLLYGVNAAAVVAFLWFVRYWNLYLK